MIKSIHSSSPFITVSGGNPGSTYIGNYSNAAGVGNMRYNPNSQNIEVYDGNTWIILSAHHANINLNTEAVSLLEWARKKRDEELDRERLAQTSPIIKDLVNQINDKEEQIKMVITLIKSSGNDAIKPSMVP
jgi:hypothetical protein